MMRNYLLALSIFTIVLLGAGCAPKGDATSALQSLSEIGSTTLNGQGNPKNEAGGPIPADILQAMAPYLPGVKSYDDRKDIYCFAYNGGGKVITVDVSSTLVKWCTSPQTLQYLTPVIYTQFTTITPNVPTGSIIGGSNITTFTVSPSLPPGLTIDPNTGVISGTPTVVSSATDYMVTAQNQVGNKTAVVNITVITAAPFTLAYTTPVVYTVGTLIPNNNPIYTGGKPTSYSVASPLPDGLTLNPITGVISGTPTTPSSATNYTITGSNSSGSKTTVVNITVVDRAPATLAYTTPVVYIVGSLIDPNNPIYTGGKPTSYTAGNPLPPGLTLDPVTGVITGTPTQTSSATNYSITGSNSGGNRSTIVNITVIDATITYQGPVTYPLGDPIPPNIPTFTGPPPSSCTISPDLPAGLTLDPTTCVISGTPTSPSPPKDYVVTGSGPGTLTRKTTVNISVVEKPPLTLSYHTPNVYTRGNAIAPLHPTSTGGTISLYEISPALPAGLTINSSTGIIAGNATVTSPETDYTVTGSNSAGSVTAPVRITVLDFAPWITIPTPFTFVVGTPITSIIPQTSQGILSITISPDLTAITGLNYDSITGKISGTPTTASIEYITYTLTATNSTGQTASATTQIRVIPPPTIVVHGPYTYTQNVGPIVPIVPIISEYVISVSISPNVTSITGLAFDPVTGTITGTPTTVSDPVEYTFTATDIFGQTASTTASIRIYPPEVVQGRVKKLLPVTNPRQFHTSTLLPDGRVLIVGGEDSIDPFGVNMIPWVNLYDPNAHNGDGGVFDLAPLQVARGFHTASLLSNGKVLFIGGIDNNYTSLTSVELYDPSADDGHGSSTLINPINLARGIHTATTLPNGKILLVGGLDYADPWIALDSVEVYDPTANGNLGGSTTLNPIFDRRDFHTATLLPNGKVLITGGADIEFNSLASVVLYDPSGEGTATLMTPMLKPRIQHSATQLSNGKFVIMAGDDRLEVSTNPHPATVESYDLSGNGGLGSTSFMTPLNNSINYHTATLLPNGRILMVGDTGDAVFVSAVESYDPFANGGMGTTITMSPLATARTQHTAELLDNGDVCVVAGENSNGPLSIVEIYQP